MMPKPFAVALFSATVLLTAFVPAAHADDIERAGRILKLVERACLAGERSEAGAALDASLSGLKNILDDGVSGKIKGEAFTEQVRGALGFVDDELKKDENDAIRTCIQPHMKTLIELLISRSDSRFQPRRHA
jgi:hypothetical protein